MRSFLLSYLFIVSCSENPIYINSLEVIKSKPPAQIQKTVLPSYDTMKSNIKSYKKRLSQSSLKNNYTFLEQRFESIVVDSIIPYWYGTEWDFNGNTQTPGKGTIACGYFVSTILRDAGIPLNRIKTGQASSEIIIRQFADKKDIKVFSEVPLDTALSFVKNKGKGLYIVGLDYHVGFLYNDGKAIWFIHSKWVNPKAVVKEDASLSGVLYYSKYRMIGKISNNKQLLDKWLRAD